MQRQKTALVCLVVVALCAGVHTQSNGPHELRCVPGNAHIGSYDYGAKPVLRIHSGETVRVETCSDAVEDPLVKPSEIPPNWKQTVDSIKDRGPGVHLLTGPIAVEGAQPGDVLEIKFLKFEFVVPFAVAAIAPNFTALPDDFPYERMAEQLEGILSRDENVEKYETFFRRTWKWGQPVTECSDTEIRPRTVAAEHGDTQAA